jgi:charged multivesicular body protein 4
MHICFCKPSDLKEPLLSASDIIDQLINVHDALEMQLNRLNYQMTEKTVLAKKFKESGEKERAIEQLRRRNDLQQTYTKYLSLQTNVEKIRNSIKETQTISEVAGSMGMASKVLEEVLKNINPEKIEELMERLTDQSEEVNGISKKLGESIESDDFDEEKALLELEQPIPQPIPQKTFELPKKQLMIAD